MTQAIQALLAVQKTEMGDAVYSLAEFSTNFKWRIVRQPIKEVEFEGFFPSGGTALLGAMGKGMDDAGQRLASVPEDQRPGRVIFVVVTDSEENNSHENEWSWHYTEPQVKEQVHRQDSVYSWKFVFITACNSTIAFAKGVGIREDSILFYGGTPQGTDIAISTLSRGMSRYRSTAPAEAHQMGFFLEDEQKAASNGIVPALVDTPEALCSFSKNPARTTSPASETTHHRPASS